MVARDPGESHRAASPLELLFDLCFVVAVAQAATGLAHALEEGHFAAGLLGFGLGFFGVWWAWMNFTWFASAFATDDVAYRLLVMVQMGGALAYAAALPSVYETGSLKEPIIAYVIMRLAMVAQWLRAARGDEALRRTALRYAAGVGTMQVLWVASLAIPITSPMSWPVRLALVAGELLVPVFAEKAGETTWHPHHIAERYGLFLIIVLGESVTVGVVAIQHAGHTAAYYILAAAALVMMFGMWWLYFDRPQGEALRAVPLGRALRWGYGHFVVFASVAAVAAGLEVATAGLKHPLPYSGLVVAVPLALYLGAVAFVHARISRYLPYGVAAVLVVGSAFIPVPWGQVTMALILAGLVAWQVPRRATGPAD